LLHLGLSLAQLALDGRDTDLEPADLELKVFALCLDLVQLVLLQRDGALNLPDNLPKVLDVGRHSLGFEGLLVLSLVPDLHHQIDQLLLV